MKSSTSSFQSVDRKTFQVSSHSEADRRDRDFWHSRTPLERLRHVEMLRELNYGSEVINGGLQRILAVLERPKR
ncbi:MAG: hypothetical protein O2960_27860 [Verrucomicrobia bacterium]|nr:hypothetical protein [Verrucomicrobiota bacterium]